MGEESNHGDHQSHSLYLQWEHEHETVGDDVEEGIGQVQLALVDLLAGRDVGVPVGVDGHGQPDVSDGGADGVAGVDADEEVADPAEPLLHKDAVVEQHEGDAREGAADGVEDVEGVLRLQSHGDQSVHCDFIQSIPTSLTDKKGPVGYIP